MDDKIRMVYFGVREVFMSAGEGGLSGLLRYVTDSFIRAHCGAFVRISVHHKV